MFFLTAIELVAIFVSLARAKISMAQCSTGFDWNKNTLGQDPCTVGSILDASCRGLMEYAYPPLTNSTEYYLPPRTNHSGDVMCDCNTVMYSLYMACAWCQGGQVYSWGRWIPECASVYVSRYPANTPQGTAVPFWAYYNITLLPNQTWNESIMISIGRDPEELLEQIETVPGPGPSAPPPSPGSSTIIRTPIGLPGPTIPPGPTNLPEPPVPSSILSLLPNPTVLISTENSPSPTSTTSSVNLPIPTIPTSVPSSPGSLTPTSITNETPGSMNPTSNANLPAPSIPTSNVNPPAPTVPTSITNLPGPTTPPSNTNFSRPTSSTSSTKSSQRVGSTSSTRSSQPTVSTSGAKLPRPTNASNAKGGTKAWATVVVPLLWILM